MKNRSLMLAICASLILLTSSGLAMAQSFKHTCMSVGSNLPEPLGDREGHGIQVTDASCISEGDSMDGAVMTSRTIWEFDKGAWNILSGDGVTRMRGVASAYRTTAGSLTFVMKDGKPVGWTATGKGVFTLATGAAAALAGKTFTWTANATGPRRYTMESKVD